MRLLLYFVAAIVIMATSPRAEKPQTTLTPDQIVDKAIAYHDPNGVCMTGRVELDVHTVYADNLAGRFGGKEARLTLVLSPRHEYFGYTKTIGDDTFAVTLDGGHSSLVVNGSEQVTEAEKERLRIRDAALYRDYCEYLYLMPMKLRDAGTTLRPSVSSVRFNGSEVWELKATYDPDVGTDTWYFYFDRETYALVGYRFYKDESKNDGEYITFEGEIVDEASGLRLPKARAWYYNADDAYLATDDIVSIRMAKP